MIGGGPVSSAPLGGYVLFGVEQDEPVHVVLVPPYMLTGIDSATSSLALEGESPEFAGVYAAAPSLSLAASRPSFG